MVRAPRCKTVRVRPHFDRRDVVDALALPLTAVTIAVWALAGESVLQPLRAHDMDMFWAIGIAAACVVLMLCAYFGHGDEWD